MVVGAKTSPTFVMVRMFSFDDVVGVTKQEPCGWVHEARAEFYKARGTIARCKRRRLVEFVCLRNVQGSGRTRSSPPYKVSAVSISRGCFK